MVNTKRAEKSILMSGSLVLNIGFLSICIHGFLLTKHTDYSGFPDYIISTPPIFFLNSLNTFSSLDCTIDIQPIWEEAGGIPVLNYQG